MTDRYDHAEVRRLYNQMPPHAYDSLGERMGHAQRLERINRDADSRRARARQFRPVASPVFDCWCTRSKSDIAGWRGVLTFDDWGDGPMCVMCGHIHGGGA